MKTPRKAGRDAPGSAAALTKPLHLDAFRGTVHGFTPENLAEALFQRAAPLLTSGELARLVDIDSDAERTLRGIATVTEAIGCLVGEDIDEEGRSRTGNFQGAEVADHCFHTTTAIRQVVSVMAVARMARMQQHLAGEIKASLEREQAPTDSYRKGLR